MKKFSDLSRLTFKRKLILFTLLISTMPVIMLGIASAYIAGESIQEETDYNQQIILRQVQYQIETIIQSLDTFSLQLANDPSIIHSMERGISMDDLETLEATLDMMESVRVFRSYNGAMFNLSLIYDDYNQIYSNHYGILPLEDFPFPDLLHKEAEGYGGSILVPPGTYAGQEDYLMMRTVTSPAGIRPIGRIVLHIKPSLFHGVLQSSDLGGNRQLLILDREGRIVISTAADEVGTILTPTDNLYHYWKNPGSFQSNLKLNGEQYQLSSQQSENRRWTYIAITPLKDTTAKSDSIRLLTWVMIGCIVLLWMGIALFGTKRLYSPIQTLFARLSIGDHKKGDLKVLGDYIDSIVHHNTRLQDRWNEQVPYLKKNTLLLLLRGALSAWEFRTLADRYSISLSGACYYVCVLEIDKSVTFHQHFQTRDYTLITYSFSTLVEEIFKEMKSCETVSPASGQVVFMIGVERDNSDTQQQIIDLVEVIRRKVDEHFHISISAAVSEQVHSADSISSAYEQAIQLLRYRPILGHGITLTSQSVKGSAMLHHVVQSLIQKEKAFLASIAETNRERTAVLFEELLEEAAGYFVQFEGVVNFLLFLLGEIEEWIRRKGFELSSWLDGDLYGKLYIARDITEVREWFTDTLFPAIDERLRQHDVKRADHELIQQVIVYIHKHYNEDVSLQQLAEHFGCSPYQISRLFKKYKQMNYVEYLIRYRMDKAKEWLIHTDLTIKEITEQLRYTTTQNFTRVFKQYTGMSPGTFRSTHRGG